MAIGAKDKELESFRVHVETFNQIRNSFVNQIGVKHQQVTAANEEIENLKKELADQTKNFSEQMQNLKEEFSSQKANWLYKMRHLEEEKDMLKNCFQNIEAGLGQRIKFETKSNGVNNQLLIDDVRHLVAEKKKLKEKVEDLEAKIVELEDNYATKVKDLKRELQDDNIKG
jgi:phage host-nuclease inhibitor protein Gam